ncbi:MAG: hypothetical protein HWD59_01595 [Coxiellaceae bacterium]|nr:MAG: hypothetical protein HWD59_01595 [Coxiellaceae bacterium]
MSNNVDDPFWDSLVTTRNMLSPKLRYLYIDELIFSSDDIKQVLENDSNNNNTKARLEEFYLNCARDGELTVVTAFVTDHAVVANPVAMDEKCEPARKGINTNTRGNSSHNVVEYFKPKRKDFPHPSIYREQAYDDFDLETFELIEARINPEIYTDYKSVVDLENYYETELANKEDHFWAKSN